MMSFDHLPASESGFSSGRLKLSRGAESGAGVTAATGVALAMFDCGPSPTALEALTR